MRYFSNTSFFFLPCPSLKQAIMKKLLLLFIVFNTISLLSFSQDEFAKLQDDFQKMMNDPKNIYGKNKAAGKIL